MWFVLVLEQVVLELNLRWDSDMKLTLAVLPKGAVVPVVVGLSRIQIFGKMRIILSPCVPGSSQALLMILRTRIKEGSWYVQSCRFKCSLCL